MSFYANLGSLKLNSTSSKLHLSASAHITLSSSDTAVTQERWLSLDSLKSSWSYRGQGLEMTIDITFEGQSLQQHSLGLDFRAASVAAVLETKLWQQLGLDVEVRHNGDILDEATNDAIAISIKHSHENQPQLKRRLHRLLGEGHNADLKPPDGVRQYGLRGIKLTLDFKSHLEELTRGRNDLINGLATKDAACDVSEPLSEIKSATDGEMLAWEASGDEIGDIPSFQDEESLQFHQLAPMKLVDPTRSDGVRDLVHLYATELVDAAVHLFVSTESSSSSEHVQVASDQRHGVLAEVVPVLFGQGYLQAMRERACFIPTISHALSFLSPSTMGSQALKLKLATLASKSTAGGTVNNESWAHYHTAFYNLTQRQTWTVLQDGVLDACMSQRLERVEQVKGFPATDHDSQVGYIEARHAANEQVEAMLKPSETTSISPNVIPVVTSAPLRINNESLVKNNGILAQGPDEALLLPTYGDHCDLLHGLEDEDSDMLWL